MFNFTIEKYIKIEVLFATFRSDIYFYPLQWRSSASPNWTLSYIQFLFKLKPLKP